MKVDKKDEYFAFQSKLIRRVCMNVITSIVVVVGLYLFIWKQRIGDLIVWILETVFDMKHEAAFYYYSDHFRGNKEIFFAVAVLLIFTVLMVRIFRWVTGYFREVNQGIESLLADDEKQIQLSPEMLPFERKLNSVKQTLAERKMETALAEQRKDELVTMHCRDCACLFCGTKSTKSVQEQDKYTASCLTVHGFGRSTSILSLMTCSTTQ